MLELKQESLLFHHIYWDLVILKKYFFILFFSTHFYLIDFSIFSGLARWDSRAIPLFFMIPIRAKPIETNLFNEQKRRERDSNPRQFFVQNYTGFQDRGYQPLSHLSERQFLFYSSEQNMAIGGRYQYYLQKSHCRKISGVNLLIDLFIHIQNPACLFVK